MAPSAIAEHAVEEVQNKVVVPKPIERIPLPKLEAKGKARPLEDHGEIQPAFPFSKAVLLDENRFKSGSRALRLAVSILLHVTVITVPILIGLFFTRSEEHTSELQSPDHLVCRLLLEKK